MVWMPLPPWLRTCTGEPAMPLAPAWSACICASWACAASLTAGSVAVVPGLVPVTDRDKGCHLLPS